MDFDKRKKDTLEKIDKSKIGLIDPGIQELVNKINSNADLFTTSSCSGRIVLLQKQKKKHECKWIYKSHNKASWEDLSKSIGTIEGDCWFLYESFILHVCARDIKSADQLLKTAWSVGLKRAGITHIDKRIMLEIVSNERIECPIASDGKLIVKEDYIKILISKANKKLEKNKKKIEDITSSL